MNELIQPKRGTVGYTRKVSGENPLRQDLKKYESEEVSVFVQYDISDDTLETDVLIQDAMGQAERAAKTALGLPLAPLAGLRSPRMPCEPRPIPQTSPLQPRTAGAPTHGAATLAPTWEAKTMDFLRTLSHRKRLEFSAFRQHLGYAWENSPTTAEREEIDKWVETEKTNG